ncbi:hypothetical protein [Christiangramia sabulilitoris]|uniref:Uncharacterized protein n=1 Tax=Christiangramia sabulilitoris TaxID=2583991 RepID=A0A550I3F6_9FLAO|nr:hypothetical protein [Christiangramia sabulilitoris]TRO65510.1 hypothetical protein FGM01_08915 [Christiangramia sabulilitoris]
MKTIKLSIFTFILSFFCVSLLNAQMAEKEILTSTEITVKPGQNAQFIEGVKKWKSCYLENNGQAKWNMWHRQQGEGNLYVMAGMDPNWASMDKEDNAESACYVILLNLILPHIENVNSRIAQSMPEFSRSFTENANYIRVKYFDVHKGYAFEQVIREVSKAIKEKEGDFRGLWFEFELGGPNTPDFMLAEPYEKYADMDLVRDSPATIYTNKVGEEKAAELWEVWFDTLENSWAYTYKLNQEISN